MNAKPTYKTHFDSWNLYWLSIFNILLKNI